MCQDRSAFMLWIQSKESLVVGGEISKGVM